MSERIEKVAFITGSAGGIGRETALLLSQKGFTLFLTDRKEQISSLKEFVGSLNKNHIAYPCDIVSPKECSVAIKECIKRFGRIDILINNAGIMRPAKFHNVSMDAIEEQIDVNIKGTIRLTHLAMPHLKSSKGKLIILSSLAGIVPAPHHSIYSATKFALRGFALSLYLEWKELGIRVTNILPGTIQSPMTQFMASQDSSPMAYLNPPLPASDVAQAIAEAIDSDIAEVYVPYSQGLLARIALLFPYLLQWIYPILAKKGYKNFELWKKKGLFG